MPKASKEKKSHPTHTLAILYLTKCTTAGAFVNRKLRGSYFAIRQCLDKQKPYVIDNLLTFLKELPESKEMTLKECFLFAEDYRLKKLVEHDRLFNLSIESENNIKYDVDKFTML